MITDYEKIQTSIVDDWDKLINARNLKLESINNLQAELNEIDKCLLILKGKYELIQELIDNNNDDKISD